MTSTVVLSTYAAICIALVFLQIRRGNELDMLPSLMWLAVMAIPYLAHASTFPSNTLARQGLGIVLVGFALLAGDWFSAHKNSRQIDAWSTSALPVSAYKFLVPLFLVGALLHLLILDDVPLLAKLSGSTADDHALAVMREQTSKLLPAHDAVKYLFNWLLMIVGPLALASLLVERRYAIAAAFVALAGAYAAMSLAKFPMVILILPVLVLLLARLQARVRHRVYVAAFVVLLVLVSDALWFFVSNEYSAFRYKASADQVAALGLSSADPRSRLSRADHIRMRPQAFERQFSFRERQYDYLAYRVLLTPVDVASRWYQYYPVIAGGFAGFYGLTPGTRADASLFPSSLVANWAYTERFPDRYLTTVRANASADADAYARFGVTGLVIAAIGVLVLRLALAWSLVGAHESQILYFIGLTDLALLLPSASLPAILVANGLILVVLLMVLVKVLPTVRKYYAGITTPGTHG